MIKREYILTVLALTLCSSLIADEFMGDYKGSFKGSGGKKDAAAQVIAMGHDMYEARIINNFDESGKPYLTLIGKKQGEEVVFTGSFEKKSLDLKANGDDIEVSLWAGNIKSEIFTCSQYSVKMSGKVSGERTSSFKMKKEVRLSPALGKKPPKKAIVLLGPDSKDLSAWENIQKKKRVPAGWKLEDGVMEVTRNKGNIVSKQEFGSYKMHLEFRLPLMADARGQGRGNSGVYNFGRYETQVLDSYGLAGRDNECGGIYKAGAPSINMCAPPLQWQTYDIDFTAPKFKDGKKVENARITVVHNGVNIQDDIELKDCTPGGVAKDEKENGPLFLQDHGNPVQYRNIWIEEK